MAGLVVVVVVVVIVGEPPRLNCFCRKREIPAVIIEMVEAYGEANVRMVR